MSEITGARPVALVTGAARRVGLAIARSLAGAGCDLVITYNRSEDEAQRAAAELRKLGTGVRLERADFEDLAATERLAAMLARELPRLDVLVHNASVYAPTELGGVTAAEAERQFRVNALAPLVLSKHLVGLLSASTLEGGGAIVAMSDIHAIGRPRRRYIAYNMSKAALTEMVRSLARDLAPRVRVNAVAPGVVVFGESGEDADPEMQRRYLSRVPLGRSGTPEDAAEAVRWLALDAKYTTGQVVRVDGGRWLT